MSSRRRLCPAPPLQLYKTRLAERGKEQIAKSKQVASFPLWTLAIVALITLLYVYLLSVVKLGCFVVVINVGFTVATVIYGLFVVTSTKKS